ncbi:MAG: response regulator transcription factor [Anaerolineales bacterium]|nr:response regulator transcription factor [Anaerolineales bacterium]
MALPQTPKRVLLIEDNLRQYKGLEQEFNAGNWQVIRAWDKASALRELQQTRDPDAAIDAVALDLGLPPAVDHPLHSGIPLARLLRAQYPNLPILAYTALLPQKDVDYSKILAELLPLSISFVALRTLPGDNQLGDLLRLVWQGFLLLSPSPADYLAEAIAVQPDPLDDALWETLHFMSQGFIYNAIAEKLPGVGVDGVRARVRRITDILQRRDELESHQTGREDLENWYRQNHVRYRRD